MAPLAGKPPFATDLPDSHYESQLSPQRRPRQPAPADPNSRSSAYDVYDSYFGNDPAGNRNSGMGAVGLGFLNADMDDDDDDDDSDNAHPTAKEAPALPNKQASPPPDKHAALAAATGVAHRKATPTPPPQYIAAPKPGYAAPIAALNLAKPEPVVNPGQQPKYQLQINPNRPNYTSPSPMSVTSTPHPLEPPISPITPAFARPRPPKSTDVSFAIPEKAIMRGDLEETLIPKRGDAGDDFWRRFSMIAKEENRKSPSQKQSAWLRKTQSGKNRLALWVWIVGLVIILAAAGGIGIAWYISHNSPSNQQPTAIGGSADRPQLSSSSRVSSVGTGTVSVKTSLHVSPTNTVARRYLEPRFTGFPAHGRRH